MNDTVGPFMNFLESVYNECHTHLLEQGTKRDQVIAFYIVLLSFVITSGTVLRNTIHAHSLLTIYVGLFVGGPAQLAPSVFGFYSYHQLGLCTPLRVH